MPSLIFFHLCCHTSFEKSAGILDLILAHSLRSSLVALLKSSVYICVPPRTVLAVGKPMCSQTLHRDFLHKLVLPPPNKTVFDEYNSRLFPVPVLNFHFYGVSNIIFNFHCYNTMAFYMISHGVLQHLQKDRSFHDE